MEEKIAILRKYFGDEISWENAAALGFIQLSTQEGEFTPEPGYTTIIVPYA